MFVPTFDNDVSVLVNHSFDLAEIVRFDALLLCENKLRAVPLELGHTTISFVLLFIRHKDRNYF
jgi:hypothetical protein